MREDKPVSPAFLFASLLWHQVVKRWGEIEAGGEHHVPALMLAMVQVIDEQRETITLPQRFAGITREIWLMQPRFEQRNSKAALRMVEQPRFRAAYDFLLLRTAAGEVEQELTDWWTHFIESDPDIRQELISQRQRAQARHSAAPADGTGRRRRSRGGRGRRRTSGGADGEPSGAQVLGE